MEPCILDHVFVSSSEGMNLFYYNPLHCIIVDSNLMELHFSIDICVVEGGKIEVNETSKHQLFYQVLFF